eukprot:TRINITY_DN22907_c0_g1_i1.p2 TRINITY_DN22907_c0_g1~~TRINITY_DN22907_c0_g1_i1.p2  ORF type:complete len:107 (+),score=31.09 TRINITY_DN22907_c0_g1_i1:159-479(+)
MQRGLVGSEMCIRDRYQRRVHGIELMVSKPADTIPGKMFIGGLSMNTNTVNLKQYFQKYGEIADCVLMMDKTTGKSRGFGFVTFKNPIDVEKVLEEKHHVLDGKTP